MMAKGEELKFLFANPNHALELWTSKEAVQKAARLGMNLNPREIKIPIGNKKDKYFNWKFKFSIGYFRPLMTSKLALQFAKATGMMLSRRMNEHLSSRLLLEKALTEWGIASIVHRQTLMAMNNDPNWSVGCKITLQFAKATGMMLSRRMNC